MRLARELRSPLAPALALTAAAVFFARDPTSGPGEASLPWLGIAALAFVAVLVATRNAPGGLVALVPLALLVAWCATSIAWSIEPDRSWSYANRAAVYLAFALVGALAGLEPGKLLYGFGGLLGAVGAFALAGKVLPWLHEGYGGLARLSAPVGYWNALALLGDIALPIGLCIATRHKPWGTVLVYGWIVAIGLTYSRGGVVVGLIVVALWMLLSKAWIETVSTLLAAGLPAAGALGVAFALSGLTSDGQSHELRVRDGLVFGVVLVAQGAIATGLSGFSLPGTVAATRAVKASLAIVLAALLVLGAVDLTHSSGAEVGNSKSRLLAGGSNLRSGWWREALDGFEASPFNGTGAGTFAFTNLRYRRTDVGLATEPHDLPLQFLSETGAVGLVLFLGAVGFLAVSARRKPGPQLALALALPAYFLHGLVDMDWDFAAVSAPVFLIAGALAVRRGEGRRIGAVPAFAVGGALAAVAISLIALWLGTRWTNEANSSTKPAQELTLARRAHRIDPLAVDPLYAEANAELTAAGEAQRAHVPGWNAVYDQAIGGAEADYERATRLQPDNPYAWGYLFSLEWNDRKPPCAQAAYTALDRLTVLDPEGQKVADYFQPVLEVVNSGKATC